MSFLLRFFYVVPPVTEALLNVILIQLRDCANIRFPQAHLPRDNLYAMLRQRIHGPADLESNRNLGTN